MLLLLIHFLLMPMLFGLGEALRPWPRYVNFETSLPVAASRGRSLTYPVRYHFNFPERARCNFFNRRLQRQGLSPTIVQSFFVWRLGPFHISILLTILLPLLLLFFRVAALLRCKCRPVTKISRIFVSLELGTALYVDLHLRLRLRLPTTLIPRPQLAGTRYNNASRGFSRAIRMNVSAS